MENPSENKIKGGDVETYTGDMLKAIANDKGGMIKKIIHEEEENKIRKENLSPESKKNRFFVLVGALFFSLSLGILIFVFFSGGGRNSFFTSSSVFSPLIFTDKAITFAVDGLSKDQISESVFVQTENTKIKNGEIAGFYLTEKKKTVGFKRFAELIKSDIASNPDSFISDNFLLGLANRSGSTKRGDLFILLSVRSFTDVFPVMRAWEDKMLRDLNNFFGIELSPESSYLFTKDFEDGIIANKNGRILKDSSGKTVLMYVFLDDFFVIITDSETAVSEAILRLSSSRIKK